MKCAHSCGWGERPAHTPLSHSSVTEVTASEQFWLKRAGGEGCTDTCARSVTSIILQSPDSRLVFETISAGPSSHQAFILVLLGSFSTAEPPVIMQFNFYPWMFDFTFHHH